MELQTYINSHENYMSDFKKLGFKDELIQKLTDRSYPYDKKPEYNSQGDMYKRILRELLLISIQIE